MHYSHTLSARLAAISVALFIGVTSLLPTALAIGVQPLRSEFTVSPGKSASATIKIINPEKRAVIAKPTIEIYTKNDLQGYPVKEKLQPGDPRDIQSWIRFSPEIVSIPPEGSKDVTVSIAAPANAEPGGHYASVVYEEELEKDLSKVSVIPRVASLLLITVQGKENRSGEITKFNVDDTTTGDQPFTFAVAFKNTGNIHLKPSGTIALFDGETQLKGIAKYVDPETNTLITSDTLPVNLAGGNILPDSERLFTTAWTENVRAGKFTARLKLAYLGSTAALTKELSFELRPEMKVSGFDVITDEKGKHLTLTLKNMGTITDRLVGSIVVTNAFDYKVAEIELPQTPESYVAPQAEKTLTIPWLAADKTIPNGRYTAKLVAVYGQTKTPLDLTTTFGEGSFLDQMTARDLLSALGALIVLGVLFVGYRRHAKKA